MDIIEKNRSVYFFFFAIKTFINRIASYKEGGCLLPPSLHLEQTNEDLY